LAAIATSAALIYTWREDRRRRREADRQKFDRACYLAIGFEHELSILYSQSLDFAKLLWVVRRSQQVKLSVCAQFMESVQIPLLTSMADRLDPFDGETGAALMKVISGVARARPPQGLTRERIKAASDDVARGMSRNFVRDAQILKRDSKKALDLINPYFKRYAPNAMPIMERGDKRRVFVISENSTT
jgi:hypothetical protein